MTQPFFMKLPVFQLENGERGLLIASKIVQGAPSAVATLFTNTGRQIELTMEVRRLIKAAQEGPFVLLHEVAGAAESAPGLIVGANGKPLG